MGYMSLDNWNESDKAADLMFVCFKSVIAEMKKELNNKANNYNTSGDVNIALMIESGALNGCPAFFFADKEVIALFDATLSSLRKYLAYLRRLKDTEGKDQDIKDYKRMIASVENFYKRSDNLKVSNQSNYAESNTKK